MDFAPITCQLNADEDGLDVLSVFTHEQLAYAGFDRAEETPSSTLTIVHKQTQPTQAYLRCSLEYSQTL